MADYATYAQFKAEINLSDSENTAQTTIERLITAASRTIDNFCNRPDGFVADSTASARYYPGSGRPYQRIDECIEVTAVAVKDSPSDDEDSYTSWTVGTVGTTTDADVFPASGSHKYPDYESLPYTLLVIGANNQNDDSFTSGRFLTRGGFRPTSTVARAVPTVKVTAKWGYAESVPGEILEACIMQSARWYKRLQSSMADTAASPDFGTLLYRKSLDPDIALILSSGRFVRPAIGRR